MLAEVRRPILFLYGDPERGSINSHESVRACADVTPADLRPAYIEGAGHSVRRDRREPYAAAVRSFPRRATRPTGHVRTMEFLLAFQPLSG